MVRPPAQTPPKSHLTLGLEIKFYAAIKSSTFNRTMPNECIVSLLGERLRRVRLSGPEGYGSMFKVVLASKDLSDEDRLVDYSRWNLTTDATARPQNPAWFRDYEGQAIEVISPPYWARTAHWENDIQRIFSSRIGQFNPISASELRLYYELNNTTSFHVHIGNGVDPDSSFPFRTVRNLAMILLVYEPTIDRLLDARLYAPPNLISTYDHSQEPQSIPSIETPYFQPPNLPARSSRRVLARHLFNTCTDIRSVIRAMSPLPPDETLTPDCPWYYKFNFNPLLDSLDVPQPVITTPDTTKNEENSSAVAEPTSLILPSEPLPQPKLNPIAKRKTPTIEFRQQIGTMDPDTMVHWVRFLTALVEFSSKLTDQAVIEFLGLEDIDIDYSLSDDGPVSNDEEQQTPFVTISTPTDPIASLSAFAILTSMQPVGSLARLLTAMDSTNIELDSETTRYWRRKVSL
ncbi:hypothetical protein MauCBS54593_000160 [Microsporum audouinii]